MSKDTKLKPCPFCRNEPSLHQLYNQEDGTYENMFIVMCTKCDVGVYMPQKEAIQAWNRRVV